MNLEQSNEFIKELDAKKKKKKVILCLIIICVICLVFLIGAIVFLTKKEANTPKLFVNEVKKGLSNTLFVNQNETVYVSVREMAEIAGYSYETGEYKKYNEDQDFCYLTSDYEVVSIENDSKKIKKYLINNSNDISSNESKTVQTVQNNNQISFMVNSNNNSLEILELENEVIKIENELYVPLNNCNKVFNVSIYFKDKDVYVYDLLNIFKRAKSIVERNNDYDDISYLYENVRAIVDNFVVVKDSKGNYGVITLNGKKILGAKYSNIQYIQNKEEFFVYVNNTVGLVDKDGKNIIKATEYDNLAVFDEVNNLYIAQKNGLYGILDRKGNEVIPITYDGIGLSQLTEFEVFDSESPNLLENKYIVVTENGKFGLYNINGRRLIRANYDGFGYIKDLNDKKTNFENVLIIPKEIGVHGLVIKQNDYYGIFDLDSRDIIIPCSLDKIFLMKESGEINYYMTLGDEKYNLKEFFGSNFDSDEYDDENLDDLENDFDEEDEEQEMFDESDYEVEEEEDDYDQEESDEEF